MKVFDALKSIPLGSLVYKAKTWSPVKEAPDSHFTYIDLSSIDQSTKSIASSTQVCGRDAPSRARQIVKPGDVLVSTVRPNLNGVARVSEEFNEATASTGFCILRPNPELLDGNYLFHWVKTPQFVSDMVLKSTGASYPAVSDRIIHDSAIPLPPLPEQKRIAAILDQAEALRAKRRAAIKLLDELTQSIFLDMFGDPVTNPKGWEVKTIEQAGVKTKVGPFGSLLHKSDYIEGGIPLVNPKHMCNGLIVHGGDETVSKFKAEKLAEYRIQVGDLLVARRGEMGRCAIVRENQAGWLCGTGSFFLRAPDGIYFPEFLESTLSSDPMRKHLENLSGGAIMPSLSGSQIKSLRLPIPPIDAQRMFVETIRETMCNARKMKEHQRIFDHLFASLQHRAFRGEL